MAVRESFCIQSSVTMSLSYPPTLQKLAILKICEDFDDGGTLSVLEDILPPFLFRLVHSEHIRGCMKIILGFYFHDGEKYCYDCARYKRPVRKQYQVVQIVGPIQISNWQKIDGQHRCVSCGSVPYFFNGRDPALHFRCRCVV